MDDLDESIERLADHGFDWRRRAETAEAELSRLRELVEKQGKVVEAARFARHLLFNHWSSNPDWRKGQEHTYMGRMDIELEKALLALKEAEGEK